MSLPQRIAGKNSPQAGPLLFARVRESLRPLRRIGWLRSTVYLAIVIRRSVVPDPWLRPSRFQREYIKTDPWGYETSVGQARLLCAARLLDSVARGRRFRSAIEISCGEGAFTQILAERCEDLLAVDFAPVALARASQRRDWDGRVKFRQWDLLRDQLNAQFDLATLMDLLGYFHTRQIKAACEKVVGLLCPGGNLLMTDVKQSDIFDTAWWSRWVIRGGKRIKRYLTAHPALKLIAEDETDTHVLAVFEKK
jgi:SAM-dependent methyltransferase